jgi:hypothetical protein
MEYVGESSSSPIIAFSKSAKTLGHPNRPLHTPHQARLFLALFSDYSINLRQPKRFRRLPRRRHCRMPEHQYVLICCCRRWRSNEVSGAKGSIKIGASCFSGLAKPATFKYSTSTSVPLRQLSRDPPRTASATCCPQQNPPPLGARASCWLTQMVGTYPAITIRRARAFSRNSQADDDRR